MGIGKMIRKRREELKLTQSELAKMVGVTASAITNYEADLSHPKEQVLYNLFSALKCDANYLFADAIHDIKNPPPLTAEEEKLLNTYHKLNAKGKLEAAKRIEELTQITEYTFSNLSDTGTAM